REGQLTECGEASPGHSLSSCTQWWAPRASPICCFGRSLRAQHVNDGRKRPDLCPPASFLPALFLTCLPCDACDEASDHRTAGKSTQCASRAGGLSRRADRVKA